MHGEESELKSVQLGEAVGETEPTRQWSYHDAYCGIGGSSAGLNLAGGTCTGAFDRCARARLTYANRCGVVPQGPWGTFDPGNCWKHADVLFSAPPCENNNKLVGANVDRQMWKQFELIDKYKYKVVVVEVVLHFKKMQQGKVFREFAEELGRRGYAVSCQLLFAPDFASSAARRRVYVVGVRQDMHQERGGFVFPIGRSRHHPLSSILEPEFFRRGVRVKKASFERLEVPKQRSKRCLRQLGEMMGTGAGRTVYGTNALATTQTATGTGPGWTSGLYEINGGVSRLTVREAARLMQISDSIELDEVEAVARRHLGNTTPVGVARGMGMKIEQYLHGNKHARAEPHTSSGSAGTGKPPTLTAEGHVQSQRDHAARIKEWQESDEKQAVEAERSLREEGRLGELELAKLRNGIETVSTVAGAAGEKRRSRSRKNDRSRSR